MAIEKKKQADRIGEAGGSSGEKPEEKTGKPITVHSYAGFKQDEKPRAFEVDGMRFTVLSVKKTWQEESEKGRHRKTFFRVPALVSGANRAGVERAVSPDRRPALGTSEVIVDTPVHNQPPWVVGPHQTRAMLEMYRD